ncbi:MAG: ABC transporter ATP-binding protein [Liquorilactobacillus nagelii]|jgi:ATP-binding cassette subfamily B multidrug efflux pump|uniref:Multidrug ABC transporter ATP-binding protein n=1 Tax=Liquorilactobacillus nagelii TaxID=82688 RepID=A0A3Q8CBY5_9LACO|nr:ABC transporter ATP-binding protein [Liquorilactobacillus nagelii]AUJ32135.1 multidrug ABC transporter ATP-binding protein [Liquorilactobacillus nagelii]MCC7615299.1 multidrug ABC transporter ATP-binding protein [Liquorilactobacillus nagelii]MCP9315452.1 ABC transporter ATP-binding protein [Liquorilactobacillus nagelii]
MELLKPYFKKNLFAILGAVISVIILAANTLWQPKLLQVIMKAIIADNRHKVFIYGIQLIVLAVIGIVAGITGTFFAAKTAQSVTADLRGDLYRKIQNFSFGNIERFSTGSLVVRLINDLNQVLNLVMMLLTQILRIPILFFGAFILGIMTIPRLWWIEILMIVLIVSLSALVFSRMGSLFGRFQTWLDRMNNVAKESMQGIRVVKSFNQEQNETLKFTGTANKLRDLNLTIGYLFALMIPAFMLISNIMILLAVYLIGTSITQHPNDLAAIASFISYLMQLMFAIIIGAMTMTMSSRGMISLKRIKEVLTSQPELQYPATPDKAERLVGDVEFKNVNFTYPNAEEPTLENISFKAPAGSFVGIVGSTGSGKTTLAQMIARLYDPSSGVVQIAGKNLRKISAQTLRNTVSFVLQKAILFSGTIEDNLKQGKHDATKAEMHWALEVSQAAEFVLNYPDGVKHRVEERSANFSGGQKQRLSIARGIIGKPPILILDDSTSALDAQSEKLVQQALATEMQATTVFMISEKISSVIHADQILVMDQGKLVAAGNHQELLKDSVIYQEIYSAQLSKEGGH